MNELFEFRKHLNIKKVIGMACLIIFIIILIIVYFPENEEKKIKKERESYPYQTYSSIDKNIEFELPKRYGLYEIPSDSALKLQSDDGLLINIEENSLVFGKSLKEVVASDKNLYTQKFENVYDVSELQEFNLENGSSLTSYKYDFNCINQGTEYHIQVYWIQNNAQYFIINICIPHNNISKYQGIESEIISSFKSN